MRFGRLPRPCLPFSFQSWPNPITYILQRETLMTEEGKPYDVTEFTLFGVTPNFQA